jgi:ABC-type bacteriocin/lantibiotic exporter with double-glycine peptidase domain
MADNHGNTPAAWTAVVIATLGFVVGGIGLMLYSWPVFWVGVALVPLAGIVGVAMSRAGYGAEQH